jgi:hypothetical protein
VWAKEIFWHFETYCMYDNNCVLIVNLAAGTNNILIKVLENFRLLVLKRIFFFTVEILLE